MTVGSQVSASSPSFGVDQINAKCVLNVVGSEIETAAKTEGGMIAFSLDETGSKRRGHFVALDVLKKVWQNMIAPVIWPTKFGVLFPRATAFASSADGIIDQSTTIGTVAFAAFSATNGEGQSFTTGAIAGNQGGYNHARLHTMRNWNPILKVLITTSVNTNLRFFVGFSSSTAIIGNNDDPLNALLGFGISKITTQANLRVSHNDGAGATISDDTGIAATILNGATAVEIEIWADGANNCFWWSINKSVPVAVTTEIPAATTSLSKQITLITTAAAGIVLTVFNELYCTDR